LDRRSWSPIEAMSTPSIWTKPPDRSTRRNIAVMREDLPAPVRPTMPTYRFKYSQEIIILSLVLTLNQWCVVCETTAEIRCHSFQRIWLEALCCSQHIVTFCIDIYSYFLPFFTNSSGFVAVNLFWWWSGRPPAISSVTFLTRSFSCEISKSVTPCNPSFWEVLDYLQKGLSNTENDSKCATGSDYNMECVAAQ
jgi:hypothetical protein